MICNRPISVAGPHRFFRNVVSFLFVERKIPETILLEASTTKNGSRIREDETILRTNVRQSLELDRQADGMAELWVNL